MAEFIFEIGCEEIPAGFIEPAFTALERLFSDELRNLHIDFGTCKPFGTPRRLGIVIQDVADMQPDRVEETLGPKVAICFDADDQPTKVAIGFAKGQGVPVESLERVEGPKGLCVKATKSVKGQATAELLSQAIGRVIPKIPFRKSMRWGSHDETFARPVHWILAILGGQVLPASFAGVTSGNESRGHRFMNGQPFVVTNSETFFAELRERFVMADIAERRLMIRRKAEELAAEAGGELVLDEDLVEEVANLVEYPFGEVGRFDDDFLTVPKEILVNSMIHHQKYFPVQDKDGRLLPCFVVFINTRVDDPAVVVAGNQRVLRARLADARFFYGEDRKSSLESLTAGLGKVTFEERLGSIAEKVARMQEQVRYLADCVAEKSLDEALRSTALCKADLLSAVVYEFPDLQGVMGRIYAALDGEPEGVCRAVEQHYWPRFATDALPQSDTAALVALADKMDTIVGCFGVGLIPSGTADPYALRRQALGILRTLADRDYRVSLKDWVARAADILASKLTRSLEETVVDVLAFFEGRYRNWRSDTFRQDIVAAVTAADFNVLPEADAKMAALADFQKQPEFLSLATAFKRVMNILKERPEVSVAPDLFVEEAEKELWADYRNVRDVYEKAVAGGNYGSALESLAQLKAAVDRFFDDVLVMDKDTNIRNNRLALLTCLADLFTLVVDFRQLQTEQG